MGLFSATKWRQDSAQGFNPGKKCYDNSKRPFLSALVLYVAHKSLGISGRCGVISGPRIMDWKFTAAALTLAGFSMTAFGEELLPAAKDPNPVPVWTTKSDQGLYSVTWSHDSQFLAIGGRGSVRVYRTPDFNLVFGFETSQQEVWGLEWAPDDRLLACSGKDGTVQIWNGQTLAKKLLQGGWVTDLAWNPDGASLMSVDFTGLAKEWDVEGFLRASIQLDAEGLGVDWSPKGRLFAVTTGHDASRLLVFDSESGELKLKIQDVPAGYKAPFGYGVDEVNGVKYSPSGKLIATTHQDGRIIVRSATTGKLLFAAQAHSPGVGGARRLAWSPDGAWILSSGEDGRVNLVQYPNGKKRLSLLETEKPVWSVAWSSDGRWIASVGEEGRGWVWATAGIPSLTSGLPRGTNNGRKEGAKAKSKSAPAMRREKKKTLLDWFHRRF
jgi:WD40 repeat protein